MNKIETHPKAKELRQDWLDNKDKMSTHAIWKTFVEAHFKPSDMFIFYKTVEKWEREQDIEQVEREATAMTEQDAEKLLELGRRRAIVLFGRIISEWQSNPKKIKSAQLRELISLYQVIRSSEEAAKRTKLAEQKEKREVVKMFLPYMRLNVQQLEALKQRFNESVARIIQLKSGGNSQ